MTIFRDSPKLYDTIINDPSFLLELAHVAKHHLDCMKEGTDYYPLINWKEETDIIIIAADFIDFLSIPQLEGSDANLGITLDNYINTGTTPSFWSLSLQLLLDDSGLTSLVGLDRSTLEPSNQPKELTL